MYISLKKKTVNLNLKGLPGGSISHWFILVVPNLLTTQEVELPICFLCACFLGLKKVKRAFSWTLQMFCIVSYKIIFFLKAFTSVCSLQAELPYMSCHMDKLVEEWLCLTWNSPWTKHLPPTHFFKTIFFAGQIQPYFLCLYSSRSPEVQKFRATLQWSISSELKIWTFSMKIFQVTVFPWMTAILLLSDHLIRSILRYVFIFRNNDQQNLLVIINLFGVTSKSGSKFEWE